MKNDIKRDKKKLSKKILIYDTSRGIASEIKKKLSEEYEVYSCLKKDDDLMININDFFAAIVIINDIDDLIKVKQYRQKIKNIMISTSLKKEYINDLILIDLFFFELSNPRKYTLSLIKEKLAFLDFHSN